MIENKFDKKKLSEDRIGVTEEYLEEINKNVGLRTEVLLLTNYVDNLLKDCIVMLTRSEKARSISRNTILEILKERKIISQEIFDDLKKINQIRDQYGHTMRLSLIEERIVPIIESMNVQTQIKEVIPEWDTKLTPMEKLRHLAIKMQVLLDDTFEMLINFDPSKDSTDIFTQYTQRLEKSDHKVSE